MAKQYRLKGSNLGILNPTQQIFGRQFFETFQFQDVLCPEIIQVGRTSCQAEVKKLRDRPFPHRVDVHRSSLNEVLDSAFDLGRASFFIGTIVAGFPFFPDQLRSALRTVGDVLNRFCMWLAL